MEGKQIFVSHSQHDKEMVASFDRVFARTGVKSVCMEFEKMSLPEWLEIKTALRESEAVFLLLGQNVKRSIYTQNWIAFEVGLSCAFNKRVWVFEHVASTVDFPIPYVTDYMLYDNLDNPRCFNYIRQIIDGHGQNKYIIREGTPIVEIPKGKSVECPHCHSKFALHYTPTSILHLVKTTVICPLCRQPLRI